MAFRTIAKGRKTENLPNRTISISKRGSIGFSRDLIKILKKYYGVEIMVDEENGVVGFKPSNNELIAYALHKTEAGRIKDLNCFSIFGGLEYKRYEARFNDGIITINLKLKVKDGRYIN